MRLLRYLMVGSRSLRRPSCVAIGSALLLLLATGTALAAEASVKLSGPHTVALGGAATLKASGYFTASKAHPNHRPNFAEVLQLRGTVNATAKECLKRGKYLAGGVAEKQWRAKTPTTPGHFSASFKVKGTKAGSFTLCGLMGNYPVGGIMKRPLALFHYTVQ